MGNIVDGYNEHKHLEYYHGIMVAILAFVGCMGYMYVRTGGLGAWLLGCHCQPDLLPVSKLVNNNYMGKRRLGNVKAPSLKEKLHVAPSLFGKIKDTN